MAYTDQFQKSLKRRTTFKGQGLHSGQEIQLEVLPAPADFGIQFQRVTWEDGVDISKGACKHEPVRKLPPLRAIPKNVYSTDLATTIGQGDQSISTIEHLMAAFAGLGIDNAWVRVDGPEIPILDGSSAPFVELFLHGGLVTHEEQRRVFVAKESVELKDGDRYFRMDPIEPGESPSIRYIIDFDSSKAIGRQEIEVSLSSEDFLESICFARTFCHIADVDRMRAAGLAKGGSLNNAVVVNDDSVMNEEGLRSHNEFVRHKLLDCMGDMYLMGAPILGKFTVYKGGHGLHTAFLKELIRRKDQLLSSIEPATFKKSQKDDISSSPVAASV